MTTKILILTAALLLPGCAALQTTAEILDILVPDHVVVCDSDSVGVVDQGKQCVKLSDGTYVWRTK